MSAAGTFPAASFDSPEGFRERFVSATDGLRLYARDYRPAEADPHALPVMCLPGLTRDSRDFAGFARHLSGRAEPNRRVVALDFRGRGRSEHDTDPSRYNVGTEAQDVLDVATALGLERAILVGTSRGGLVSMILAALRPTFIAGTVLNDIGPEIPTPGLLALRDALSRTGEPQSWDDAAATLAAAYGDQFPGTDRAGWSRMARAIYAEENGRPVISYDKRLLDSLDALEADSALPPMWAQFDALATAPVFVMHGENSRILTREILGRMRERQPALRTMTVPDAGHVPSLTTPAELEALTDFFSTIDGH